MGKVGDWKVGDPISWFVKSLTDVCIFFALEDVCKPSRLLWQMLTLKVELNIQGSMDICGWFNLVIKRID